MKFKRLLSGIIAFAMTASCIGAVPQAASAEDDLMLYLSFDSDNADAIEGSVREVGGKLVYDDGISGRAARLTGNGTYLELKKGSGSPLLAGLDEFTVSFWSNTADKSWYFYTSPNANAQTYPKEQYIGILDNISSVLCERYENSANTGKTRPEGNSATAAVSGGAWKHIALVESADRMKIYVNGILAAERESSVDISDLLGSAPVAYIGKANWGSGEFADGLIDEYKIYSKALSDGEIAAEYDRVAGAIGNGAWENIKDDPHVVFADYFNDGTTAPEKGRASENGTIAYSSGPDGSRALRLNTGANYLQIFDEDGHSPLKGRTQAAIAFKAAADDITKTSWYVYAAADGSSPKRDPRNYIAALNIGSNLTLERYSNTGYMAEMARAKTQAGFHDVVILLKDNRTEIYIDGSFAAEKQESGTLADILGTDPVTYIGFGAWWGEYTNGITMDNIEIYDAAPMIELGDTAHLEGDIDLPTSGDGITVEWSTSDASVITADGRVTRPRAGKASAVLTARVKMGNIEYERDFPVAVYGTENAYDIGISIKPEKGVDIQKNMYGLFFEDISYAADGGLSAEKIENRSFEQVWQADKNYGTTASASKKPGYAWTAAGAVSYPTEGGVSEKNPTFARLTGTKLSNAAYEGVYAKKGDTLNISFYARSDSFRGSISVGAGSQTVEAVPAGELTNEWKKYEVQLTMTEEVRKKPFDVILSESGTVDLDMISCIPSDAVFGVFRRDLAEKLKALEPGFLRFPGGCIIEGFDLANRYQWKKSVGPAEERGQNWTRWGGAEYNQSLAIGYFEYLELCEYLNCDPVPVLNVGLSCEYNRPKETVPVYASQVSGDSGVTVDGAVYSSAFYEYIQDALDLIEFCNGTDDSNEWTALRKSMGHDAPFGLTMLGIGNEQWQISGNQWHERYEAFERVIHKYYPDMKLISTSGPSSDDRSPDWDFSNAWKWIREKKASNDMFTYATDEHYYNSADWFFENTDRYDSYTRNAKVFAGEYAANGTYGNTIYSALAEAAAMTGFERNADVVYMASYAPLFCREGFSNWSPNMIWFDDAVSYGKPDYYEQQMFMQNNGSYTLLSETDKTEGDRFFESVSYDEETKDVIVKAVNPTESKTIVNIDLSQIRKAYGLEGTTQSITLAGNSKTDTNSLSAPENVVPVTAVIKNTSDDSLKYEMPSLSFVVLRIHTTNAPEGEYSDRVSVAKSSEPTSIISAGGSYVGHSQFSGQEGEGHPISEKVTAGPEDGYNTLWEIKPSKADASRSDYVSIQSVNKPELYISAANGSVTLTQDTDGAQGRGMTFITAAALNGRNDMVSFESLASRGSYLTVSEGIITLTDGADADSASFRFDSENAVITRLLKSEIPPEWADVEAIDTSEYTAAGVFEPDSGNPIIPGYIGDPFIFRDDDGTFYVLGTTDGYGEESMGGIGGIYNGVFADNTSPFCIRYSKDLVSWRCKTLLFENGDFPKEESVLRAPAMTRAANGKYYMVYSYKAYNCYIAEADDPLGPWRGADGFGGEKLSWNGDDSMLDSDIVTLLDGRTYLVTMGPQTDGKNTVWLGLFSEDMRSLERFEPIFNDGVSEGPGLFERDGKYYLTFSNGSLGDGSYRVDYAMSDELWGGYTGMGNIMSRNNAISVNTTGHSSAICVDGEYYICYHRKVQVGSGGRSAAMERMEFNEDGTIRYITPTVNGARPSLPLTNEEENLAWGGIRVIASSEGNISPLGTGIKQRAEYAADRNNGTSWTAADTGDQWYEIDLGEQRTVGRIETFFEYHTLAYKYKIEYSTDGESWELFSDRLGNTDTDAPASDKAAAPVSARYIRYSFPEGGVNVMRDVPVGICEIGIYSSPEEKGNDISRLDAGYGDDGKLVYSADYVTDNEEAVLYIAAYGRDGRLITCAAQSRSGAFEAPEAVCVKAYLWDKDMKPIAVRTTEIKK